MKVMLANPPWVVNGRKGVRAGSRWPHLKVEEEGAYLPFPFYLAYSAAVLHEDGTDVVLCDSIAEDHTLVEFFDLIAEQAPDCLLIETSTPSFSYDMELIRRLRKFYPGKLFLAGPHAGIHDGTFLESAPEVDAVFVGEYEYTFRDVVRHLHKGRDIAHVEGGIFRTTQGTISENPRRPLIENLDELPWPLRNGLPMERYEDRPGGIPAPCLQMWASRGCPYRCKFCLWPQVMYGGQNYRVRSPDLVVEEMEAMADLGFRSFYFDDDTFNLGKKRLMTFAAALKDRGWNYPWAIMARPDTMDEEILTNLREAGLEAVKYGVESGVQQLVDNIDKSMDLEVVERNVALTKALGINVHLTFTFGLPGETAETIQRTIDFVLELDPDSVQFSVTTPFPGTTYLQELKDQGLLVSEDWDHFDGNYGSVIRTETLSSDELIKARERAYEVFKTHKEESFVRHNLIAAGILHGEKAFTGPYLAQIDPTDNCNQNCIACWTHSPMVVGWDARYKPRDALPYSALERTIRELADMGTQQIYFAGGGEPFMHPQFMDLVALTKKLGMGCHINTNFSLVTDDHIDQLIDLEVDFLILSFWAASSEVYRSTHPNKRGDEFDQIKDKLCKLTSKKQDAPRIKIYNVMLTHNYHEVEAMIEFALETGVEEVEFAVTDIVPGKTDELILSLDQRNSMLEPIARLKETVPYDYVWHDGSYIFSWPDGKRLTVFKLEHFVRRLLNPDAESGDYDSDIIKRIPCYIGWTFTRIMANGDINACLKAHRMPMGNLYEQSFTEIWNGALQREFRRKAIVEGKDDPYFSRIGNDPSAEIGCYRGCDDITRNVEWHAAMTSFDPNALAVLKRYVLEGYVTPCGE
jgi:radical SAM superfamily enzyme YgiQ (UPF0313 family)